MKRILFAAAALMALVGCQKDEVTTPSGTMPKVITASFEQAGGSRVAVDNSGKLTWTDGDQFNLFDKNDNSKKDLYNINEGVGQATASFVLQGPSQVSEAAYAVYPRVSLPTISNGNLSLFIDQYAYLPMLAKISSAENISFKHLCAALRINITEIPEGYTYTIIEASEPISGDFEADLSAAEPVLVAIINGMTSYKALYAIDSESEVVDMPLPVGTYESLTVKIAKDHLGAEAITLKSWSNLDVKRAKLYTTSASGQVVDLSQMPIAEAAQVEAVAEAFTEALANPEVEEIKLPESVQLPMTEPITFAAPTASAAASASRAETAVTLAARDITIDGNGGTLVWKGVSGGRVIDVKSETNGMSLTLKNLTIENQTGYTQRGVNYNTNGKLTLEKVTIKSAENCAITYAVNLPSSSDNATVEITNSDICGHIALNLWGENTKATITNSTLSNFDNTEVENYATIVLNNNGTDTAKGSEITITGGEIIAKDEKGDPCTAVSNPALGTVTIDETTEVIGELRNNVAIVDYGTDNYYGCLSLQEAVDTASETAGCTVILLTPIELTETVTVPATADFTLDLNGQTISQSSTEAVSMLVNNGSLKIKDSVDEGAIALTFTGTPNPSVAANTISNRGVLVVDGGEISNTGNGNQIGYAIDNYNGATLTVNNGTITASGSSYYDGVRLFCGSTETVVTVNDGTISTIWAQNPSAEKATEVKGTVIINGGTIGTTYYENYTTVKVKNGVTATVTPYGNGKENTTTTEIDGYTVYSFDHSLTVATVADLAAFAAEIANGNNFAGETVKLTQNITLTEEFSPIAPGTRSSRNASGTGFAGVFDGGGNTIDGLTITSGDASSAIGFFGIIDGGEVKNVNFTNVNINVPSCENAGTVAGLVVNGGKVSGVTVSGSVAAKRGNGGIVGRLIAHGEISDCVNNATMTATAANVGGIVVAAYYTSEGVEMTISNCTNNGAINSTYYGVGGIVGLSSANVIDCTNTAEVTGAGSSIGGVVGEQQNAGSVINCTNTKSVTNNGATGTYGTGGIIGWIRYTGATSDYPRKEIVEVSGCTNEGSVKGTADAGGIVGVLYNLGNIHDNKNYAASLTASAFAAGIVANAQFTEGTPGMTSTEKVQVVNNLSTTAIENITANCTDLYVYDNSTGANLIASGNTQQ